jgi:class 3 adenylate cyclase
VAIAVFYFILTSWLFDWQAVMLDILLPFLTIAGSYSLVTAYRYSIEARRRQDMTQLFTTHLAPELVPSALTAVRQGKMRLKGQAQIITVLFMRLQSDNEYTLTHEPEQIMAIFQARLQAIREAVFAHNGTMITTSSQQAVAIFNMPMPQPDHVERAVTTAAALKKQFAADSPIQMHFAIATGRAIMGYAEGALTAVGETIQTAADLTALARPRQILLTSAAQERLSDAQKEKASPSISMPGDAYLEQVYELQE